jgi:hypothetical protein
MSLAYQNATKVGTCPKVGGDKANSHRCSSLINLSELRAAYLHSFFAEASVERKLCLSFGRSGDRFSPIDGDGADRFCRRAEIWPIRRTRSASRAE